MNKRIFLFLVFIYFYQMLLEIRKKYCYLNFFSQENKKKQNKTKNILKTEQLLWLWLSKMENSLQKNNVRDNINGYLLFVHYLAANKATINSGNKRTQYTLQTKG